MGKLLFANLRLHKKTPLTLLSWMLAFFLLGLLMVWFMVGLTEDETTWFPMGGLLAAMGIVSFSILCFLSYHQDFMLALSFGRTRKEFMLLFALEQLIWIIAAYLGVILVAVLEEVLYSQLFPGMPGDISLIPFLTDWRVFLSCIAALVILPMFLGTLHSRFGKRFGIILYFIWLFLCLVLPRLVEHLESHWNLSFFKKMPVLGWIILGIGALAAMLITTVKLGMKQAVR